MERLTRQGTEHSLDNSPHGLTWGPQPSIPWGLHPANQHRGEAGSKSSPGQSCDHSGQLSQRSLTYRDSEIKMISLMQDFSFIKLEHKHSGQGQILFGVHMLVPCGPAESPRPALEKKEVKSSPYSHFLKTFYWKKYKRKNVTLCQQYISLDILTQKYLTTSI